MMMPMWMAILLAVFVSCIGMVAFRHGAETGPVGAAWRLILVVVGGLLTWLAFGPTFVQQSSAVGTRATVAAAPTRPLPRASEVTCLDTISDAVTEAACKKALFASPETVMASVAHTQSRLLSLAEGVNLAKTDSSFQQALEGMQRSIEADPFGLVAQVLAMQGCNADCDVLKLLRDPQRILENLKARTFETIVAERSASWTVTGSSAPAADVPQAQESLANRFSAVGSTPPAPVPSVTTGAAPARAPFEYPSAASIPPISIMNPETSTPQNAPPVERRSTTREQAPAGRASSGANSSRALQ
jgi:hypothetical protein